MTPFALTRRHVMAASLALVASPDAAAAPAADPFSGEALYRDVVRYAAFGDHRTATAPDLATSEWLADELRKAGLKARLSPWTHQQFHLRAAGLKVDGRDYDSFPLWWPAPTGPTGLAAPLMEAEQDGSLKGRVALVTARRVPGASLRAGGDVNAAIGQVIRRGAAGAVLVTRDPSGELVALNAMAGLSRWDIPVLCVGQRDETALRSAARAGAVASLLVDGDYDYAARAYEVIGTLQRGTRTVVVSTPTSGWFTCAGERGPGVALWLALARAAVADRRHSYVFVGSSGHEMEAIGLRHFLGAGAPAPAEVVTWLHLGAGIATYGYDFGPSGPVRMAGVNPARRLMTDQPGLMGLLEHEFAGLPGLRPTLDDTPGGEMVLMARQGYPVWGFAGGSAFHHMRSDTPERVTGPELLEPVARATQRALTRILQG